MKRSKNPAIDWVHRAIADRVAGGVSGLVTPNTERRFAWKPIPDSPQVQALLSTADELFFGGGAGGGKSDLLLGLALTQHKESIIFRREYPQLKGLIKRSREIVGREGRYNSTEKVWSLADGRSLEFGAMQYEEDKEKYQGRPHDLKGFDEITHFTESQYTYTIGWNRTADPNQRCRVVCTGNPPTNAEGQWVARYWGAWLDPAHPNPAKPGELRWYATIAGESIEVESGEPFEYQGETIYPRSRTFIPARVADNPYLKATNYASVLQGLPEPLRSQLLYGDFSIGLEDDIYQVIPTKWVDLAQARWEPDYFIHANIPQSALGVDPARGGKDETAIAERWGNWFSVTGYPGKETPDGRSVVERVLHHRRGRPAINVDVVGVGSSPVDILRDMGLAPYALSSGAAAVIRAGNGKVIPLTDQTGTLGFTNLRAYWWWKMREALDPELGSAIALPPLPELKSDLCSARWKLSGNKIQVESKDDIKKRIGRSPGKGEAVVYANIVNAVQRSSAPITGGSVASPKF